MVNDLLIVSGASSGLGMALTRSAPFPSHKVDISRSGASGVSEHIVADLADPGTWAITGERLSRLIDEIGPQRATFIHSAGTIEPIGFAGEAPSDRYTASVLLNAAAGQVLGHHFLRASVGRVERVELAMISSGAASKAYPGWSSYGAAKAALDHWVRTVGAEQRLRGGALVLSIAPGVIDTPMQERVRSADVGDFPSVGRFAELHEDGELTPPDEAAERIWRIIESNPETGSVLDARHYFE